METLLVVVVVLLLDALTRVGDRREMSECGRRAVTPRDERAASQYEKQSQGDIKGGRVRTKKIPRKVLLLASL